MPEPIPLKRREEVLSFENWLRRSIEKARFPNDIARLAEDGRPQVGKYPVASRTIIAAARTAHGFEHIPLNRPTSSTFQQSVEQRWRPVIHSDDWEFFLSECNRLLPPTTFGIKAQVVFAEPPISEAHLALNFDLINYFEARAFHNLCSTNIEALIRYRKDALRVTSFGTRLPNILSTGIVTIIGSEEPLLAIGLRGQRGTGYDGTTWACVGEQFNPVSQALDGRETPPDLSILASAKRGLAEEILGADFDFDATAKISIHALLLEDTINNYQFLAIADLRPMTFKELAVRCRWPRSIDAAEHLAVAALPATPENILRCLQEPRIPQAICQAMQDQKLICKLPADDFEEAFNRSWVANMPMQLAAALWYVEEVLQKRQRSATMSTMSPDSVHPLTQDLIRLGMQRDPSMPDSVMSALGSRRVIGATVEELAFDNYKGLIDQQIIVRVDGEVEDHLPPRARFLIKSSEQVVEASRVAAEGNALDVEKHKKDCIRRKVHWHYPSGTIIDQGDMLTLELCVGNWHMSTAIKKAVEELQKCVAERGFPWDSFPRRLDCTGVIIASNNKILLGKRTQKVDYEKGMWSILGEQVDMEQDSVQGKLSLRKTIHRMFTDHDEINLDKAVARNADVRYIAAVTEWNLFLSNLVAVVRLNVPSKEVDRCFHPNNEHEKITWLSPERDTLLDVAVTGTLDVPGTAVPEPVSALTRYALVAALFHLYGFHEIDSWIHKKASGERSVTPSQQPALKPEISVSPPNRADDAPVTTTGQADPADVTTTTDPRKQQTVDPVQHGAACLETWNELYRNVKDRLSRTQRKDVNEGILRVLKDGTPRVHKEIQQAVNQGLNTSFGRTFYQERLDELTESGFIRKKAAGYYEISPEGKALLAELSKNSPR